MPMAVDIIQTGVGSDNNNNSVDNEDLNTSTSDETSEDVEVIKDVQYTQYEKLCRELSEDERCIKEFSLGKRIGFYRVRNDIGSGNFAKVKLGFHCLVKGKLFKCYLYLMMMIIGILHEFVIIVSFSTRIQRFSACEF